MRWAVKADRIKGKEREGIVTGNRQQQQQQQMKNKKQHAKIIQNIWRM